MGNLTIISNLSELSLAAYANLTAGNLTGVAQQDALKGAGFATTQISNFASRYTVVTQFNDTRAEGGMGTSFSATVFKDASGNLTLVGTNCEWRIAA